MTKGPTISWRGGRKWHRIPRHLTRCVNLSETEAIALIVGDDVGGSESRSATIESRVVAKKKEGRVEEAWVIQRLIGHVLFY